MSKIKHHQIPKEKRTELMGRFYEIVTTLRNKKDTIGFFMGLLTQSEALMFARRIEIAGLLLQEKSYDDICNELKVGKSTVMSVSRWLYGEDQIFRDCIKDQFIREGKLTKRDKKKHFNIMLEPHKQIRALQRIIDDHV